MTKLLPVGILVVGLVSVVLSLCWGTLFPPTNSWTEEKSQRLSDLGGETNLLQFQIVAAQQQPTGDPRQDPEYLQAQYEKKLAEYDELKAEFDSARDSPQTITKVLLWTGLICVLAAAIILKQTSAG